MSSRKEQKEALRRERLQREQEAAAADRRRRLIGYGAAGVLVLAAVVAIGLVVALSGGDDSGGETGGESRAAEPTDEGFVKASVPAAQATDLEDAAKAAQCEVNSFPSEGQNHTQPPYKYKTNPPTSGDHFEFPAEDGSYRTSPEIGQFVHSLEHGRVIFWHSPSASEQLRGQLKALFDEDSYHVTLAPNTTKMPYEVAASGWTKSLTCKKANDKTFDALRMFRDRYRDQGPERVP